MFLRCCLVILGCWSLLITTTAKPVSGFLPKQQNYLDNISAPEQVLGFELGQRHARHHQILSYFTNLASQSERVKITEIGESYQHRKQVLVTISSAENLTNLDAILAKRKLLTKSDESEPLVIWLGYGVHGDELSGVHAAMAVAYYLAASQAVAIETLLADTVIVMEPSVNPDGLDRFVTWLDTFGGKVVNADPAHIEHHQAWPTGRTNHYWFDLNRDWLLLSQQETQNRLAYYHLYQPHVLADYHEMGPNKSYFFQPGVLSRTHPLTPRNNITLTNQLASFHATALDSHDRLYFSQEGYDDFFYGKGSTYPDINGGVGILFEQASSQGLAQNTVNGVLTFEYGIENNIFTSLSTIRGAWENRQALKKHRLSFYQQAKELADDEDFDGYLLHEADDNYRLNALLSKLAQHQIQVYGLTQDYSLDKQVLAKNSTYYVPLAQPQYRVIKALFEQQTRFQDNSFYDISGWTLPLAMNIAFHEVEKTRSLKLTKDVWQPVTHFPAQTVEKSYAYAIEWHDYLAPKVLNELLNNQLKVKVASEQFTALSKGKKQTFASGTLIIPTANQQQAHWLDTLYRSANNNGLTVLPLSSGLTSQGVDLGSPSMVDLIPVNALLVGGNGISAYEAGEVRFYLEETLNMPLTIVEKERLLAVDLSAYSHVIMVDGDYQSFSETIANKLTEYVEQGGVIYAQKHAAKWLADNRILKARFATQHSISSMYINGKLSYQQQAEMAAKQRIAGAIFDTTLDLGHPLSYGYKNANLPVFRNSTLIIEKINVPFAQVLTYSQKPLLSGYTDELMLERLAQEPVLVAHNLGKGRVIASSDNLLFRGYWLGTAKLFANSLFFAKVFNNQYSR
ncbi:M14 family zinc carboxypeptidase [Thalassotalea agariperforans]